MDLSHSVGLFNSADPQPRHRDRIQDFRSRGRIFSLYTKEISINPYNDSPVMLMTEFQILLTLTASRSLDNVKKSSVEGKLSAHAWRE